MRRSLAFCRLNRRIIGLKRRIDNHRGIILRNVLSLSVIDWFSLRSLLLNLRFILLEQTLIILISLSSIPLLIRLLLVLIGLGDEGVGYCLNGSLFLSCGTSSGILVNSQIQNRFLAFTRIFKDILLHLSLSYIILLGKCFMISLIMIK